MHGRLEHLTCRYRVISDSGSGSAAPARLDRLVREQLAEACERSLDQLMSSGPEVYVVRRVEVSLSVNAKTVWEDTAVARAWGARVAQAAVTEVALRGADSSNVVQFEDQADYVASFLADLLSTPADRWFYGCFARLRRGTVRDTVMAVLEENQEHVPAILVRLRRNGALERLLTELDASALDWIWRRGVDLFSSSNETEAMRPVFAAALRLAGLAEGPDGRSGSAWGRFEEYLASGPAPPDWRDPASLALAVIAAVEFLARHGYLVSGISALGRDWSARGAQALAQFDWLNTEMLEAAIQRWVSDPGDSGPSPDASTEPPLRPAGSTPRRRRLISDLAAALSAGVPALRSALDSPASALRFYALLGDQDLSWAGDPLAARAIQGLLATAAWIAAQPKSHGQAAPAWIRDALAALAATNAPEAALAVQLLDADSPAAWKQAISRLEALAHTRRELGSEGSLFRLLLLLGAENAEATGRREHDLQNLLDEIGKSGEASFKGERSAAARSIWTNAALASLGEHDPAAAAPRQFLQAFGDAGLELAAAIASAAAEQDIQRTHPLAGMESPCAGVFLLLRAMRDARLPSIAREAGYPLTPCLLALGLRLGGEHAVLRGRIDAGLCALAGHPGEMTLAQLRAIWQAVDPGAHARFQAGMLKSLLAHRILGGADVELYHLDLDAGSYAFACGTTESGAESGAWMPASIVDDSRGGEASAIAALAQVWREATGHQPRMTAAPERSQAVFHEALESLTHGTLGIPEVDLTLGLAALAVLRVWSKWLRQFSSSSVPYLLKNFIRRPGRIVKQQDLLVEIAPQALDIVLEMSGCVGRFHAPEEPWQCNVDLRIRGA